MFLLPGDTLQVQAQSCGSFPLDRKRQPRHCVLSLQCQTGLGLHFVPMTRMKAGSQGQHLQLLHPLPPVPHYHCFPLHWGSNIDTSERASSGIGYHSSPSHLLFPSCLLPLPFLPFTFLADVAVVWLHGSGTLPLGAGKGNKGPQGLMCLWIFVFRFPLRPQTN